MQNIIHVEATNLPDLWYQTLYKAVEVGRDFTVDSGSYEGQERKEFDFVVLRSKCPGIGELLPKLNPALNLDDPCAQNFLDDYLPYLMTGEEQPGEAYCYDRKTQVLTNNGWKYFKNLKKGIDLLATINPKNDNIEYQPLIKLHSMHYSGEMHKYQTKQIDCCVTPNHKMYISNGNSRVLDKSFKLIKSNEIKTDRITFKNNGNWIAEDVSFFTLPECTFDSYKKPERSIPMDDWLAFFGTWLADGSLRRYKNNSKKSYGITITKYNQPEWLNDILDKIVNNYSYYKKDYVFNNKQIYLYLDTFGLSGDKFIPRELLNLSKRQLTILFENMYRCDGTKNNKRKYSCYSTKSYKLALGVQELLLKIGLSGSISEDSGIFKVRINIDIPGSMAPCTPSILRKNRIKINYNNNVYCAEVEKHHTLYVKRNEKPCWSGNTYGQRICKADAFSVFHQYIEFSIDEARSLLPESILWRNKETGILEVNQMELMIWTYKNKGYRNNQMIMQVGQPSDMILKDPPCLRHIDTRIQNNLEKEQVKLWGLFKKYFGFDAAVSMTNEELKRTIEKGAQGSIYNEDRHARILAKIKACESYELHFYPYFRSWDLWGGLPANLAAIEMMKQYCAEQIGVENGEIIATSKGLHLYNYVWEIAETVRGKSADEFKAEMMDQRMSLGSHKDFRVELNMPHGNHISRG